MNKTVIAFAAHHDDIELRAGGTIAKFVRDGYRVIYVVAIDSVFSMNECPNGTELSELSGDDILAIRENECSRGAEILGTEKPIFLHFKPSYYWTYETRTSLRPNFNSHEKHIIDGMKQYKGNYFCLEAATQEACVNEIMDFIEGFNPEIVLTQNANDFHLEHYSTAALVFKACQRLAVERQSKLSLYGWEMGSGGRIMPFFADRIIDISDTFTVKKEALKSFQSQILPENMDVFQRGVEASARFWGKKIGVEYAEPFVKYLTGQATNGFDQTDDIYEYSSRVASDVQTVL
jgi:LmbE family N-acetylglucosaminyl deacetylase